MDHRAFAAGTASTAEKEAARSAVTRGEGRSTAADGKVAGPGTRFAEGQPGRAAAAAAATGICRGTPTD